MHLVDDVQVFSSAYQKKLKHLEERQSVAEAAAQFSLDLSNDGHGRGRGGGDGVEAKEEDEGDEGEEEEDDNYEDVLSPKSDS